MRRVFLVFGLKTQEGRMPKFKLALIKDGIDINQPIALDAVIFSGCEDTVPEHIAALLIRAGVFARENNLEIASTMNGYYVSQSSRMLTPVNPIEDKKQRHLLNENFGIFRLEEIKNTEIPVSLTASLN